MLGAMRTRTLGVLFSVCVAGCAYPRYTTPLNTVNPRLASKDQPASLYTFKLIGATIPPTKPSGLPWDDDHSGPDPFVKLIVDGRLVWKSEVLTDQLRPQWNVILPNNVDISANSDLRIELWDFDTTISADPVGQLVNRGLPATVMTDAEARLPLDNLSSVTILLGPPRPHKGVGLSVEARSDALKVYDVLPFSPAARAGIRPGDFIVAIGNERVAHVGSDDAVSELALVLDRSRKLTLRDATGKEREVTLDTGFVWLVM